MTEDDIAEGLRAMAARLGPKPRITLSDLMADREPQPVLCLTEDDTESAVLALRKQAERFHG